MQLDYITPRGAEKRAIRAVIETPRGCRNKYSYDADEGFFLLKKVLPEGHVFPFDFGFIPRTKGEDGDPIDVLVLMDEPAFPGCIVECRLVAVIRALQWKKGKKKKVRNDRFIAVSLASITYREIADLADFPPNMLEQIEHFFVSYNEEAGKEFKVEKILGAKKAWQLAKVK